MVTDSEGMIVKTIGVRMLRPSQMDDLSGASEPVIYVPWSALVSQVLDQLNAEDRSVAVVVNEFGELVGATTIDEIMRRVLAPKIDDAFLGEASIQEIDTDTYRVFGGASVRRLAKRLGIEFSGEGITTIAGYVQRHNERLPRPGDSAPMDRFLLTVIEQVEDVIWIEVHPRTQDTRTQDKERKS